MISQTLAQEKTKNMMIRIDGSLEEGVTSKDIVLHVIGIIGTAGGTGYTIEFAGSAVETLSMEARMSISNMAIEAGARAGIIAPDDITYGYLKGRPMCPTGEDWDKAVAYWNSLRTDEGAQFDETITIDAKDIAPTVTWGTSPQDVVPVTGSVPVSDGTESPVRLVRTCIFGNDKKVTFPKFAESNLFVFFFKFCCCRRVSSVHWRTLDWKKDKRWRESRSKRCSLDLVPTDVLRIFATLLPLLWVVRLPMVSMLWLFPDPVW
jgi:homoaconitase/3-isopropylmalate dehydratase large subunit